MPGLFRAFRMKAVRPWAAAFGFAALAFLAQRFLRVALPALPLLPFYPALILAAFLCGWRQAVVLALVFGAIAFHGASLSTIDALQRLRLIGFIIISAVTIGLAARETQVRSRLRAEAALQATLFSELRHRVANSMQLVAALLAQLRKSVADPETVQRIAAVESKLAAMARLHLRLSDLTTYKGGLETLLRDLLTDLFKDLPVQVTLRISADRLGVGQTVALTLLVIEAATNAAKHVFALHLGRCFEVELRAEGDRLRLDVRDDGPGIQGQVPGNGNRLGFGIMQALAAQLGGTLVVGGPPGTCLSVRFARE